MRILLTVAAWGREYANLLANYSIASQLSPNNIPRLAARHAVTYHIVTSAADRGWMAKQPQLAQLEQYCDVHWDLMEAHNLNPKRVPRGNDDRKYPFLSLLQNLAFAKSGDFDAIVFNYADFIWSDGSLDNAVTMLREDADAVLSFCLPVDQTSGKAALDRRQPGSQAIRNIPPRELARIAIDHLHRETRLRFWDAPSFTSWPSYLLWPVASEGLLVRAYHQTVLALRVDRADPNFHRGISRGSLDGDYTATLAAQKRIVHATDSDAVMVFSLYHTSVNTALRGRSRKEAFRSCLGISVAEAQRRFAETPILVKSKFEDLALWREAQSASEAVIQELHREIPFNREAHDEQQRLMGDLESSLRGGRLSRWLFSRFFIPFVNSAAGNVVKRLLGPFAHRWRARIERAIFGR
jgi:hypothetical protein